MPASPKGKKKSKGKDDGGFLASINKWGDKVEGQFEGVAREATGIPAGLLEMGKASNKALHGDTADLQRIGTAIAKSYAETARHPLRNIPETLMLGLGAAAGGGGAVARAGAAASAVKKTGSIGKAAKAAARKPIYTRQGALGMPVDASPNPIARAAGAVGRKATPKLSMRRAAKEQRERDRFIWQMRKEDKQPKQLELLPETKKEAKQSTKSKKNIAADIALLPSNIVRAGFTLKPGYAVQNAAQTALMQALAGTNPVGAIRSAAKLRKNPETYRRARGAMGTTGVESRAIGADTPGLGTITSKGAGILSVPEGMLRVGSLVKEAKRRGYDSPEALEKLLSNPESNPDFFRTVKKGNDSVVDYSRLGPREQAIMRTGLPFLYPLLKNTTRWAGQYPLQNSVKASLLQQLGQLGAIQRDKDFPEGQPGYNRWLEKSGDKTFNLRNINPLSIPVDLAGQAINSVRGEGFNTLQGNASPSLASIFALLSGHDIESGRNVSNKERFGSSLLQSAPGAEFIHPRDSATFGKGSLKESLLKFGLGSAFAPRETDFDELAEQAKRDSMHYEEPRRRRRPARR